MNAFVFPGQGAQKPGMGKALAEQYAVARQTFEEADDVLGLPISRLCFEGPGDQLQLTANSQPAILATSVAVLRVVEQETPLRPAVVAGHSLGEYSALVAAQALSLADALRLVRKRGELMQDAVPAGEGGMAAVMGLTGEKVADLCQQASEGEVVSPANLNGGRQVVVAGHAGAVGRLVRLAKSVGARAIPLKVSAPFHCSLMDPAAERLAQQLATVAVSEPRIPVISNVDAEPNVRADRVGELLYRQVTAPVLWEASVGRMEAMGVRHVTELGPGKVLAGLIKRITNELTITSVEHPDHIEHLSAAFRHEQVEQTSAQC